MKLVFIVDNSYSMADKQQRLATAVGNMLDSMRNYAVEIYIYTTTTTSTYAGSSTVFEEMTESPDQLAVPSHPPDTENNTPHIWWRRNRLSDPLNSSSETLMLQTAATDSEFMSFKSNVLGTFRDIGTNGDPIENGLCTMAYILGLRHSTTDMLKLRPGDLVGYVILSDEDVASGAPVNCTYQIAQRHLPSSRLAVNTSLTRTARSAYQRLEANYQVVSLSGSCEGSYRDNVFVTDQTTYVNVTEDECHLHPEICATQAEANIISCSSRRSSIWARIRSIYLRKRLCARYGPT